MTARPEGPWHALLEASRPERARLRAFVLRAVEDLARSTAYGAAALGTCNVAPPVAVARTTNERGD